MKGQNIDIYYFIWDSGSPRRPKVFGIECGKIEPKHKFKFEIQRGLYKIQHPWHQELAVFLNNLHFDGSSDLAWMPSVQVWSNISAGGKFVGGHQWPLPVLGGRWRISRGVVG
jgi:hypothetical protein